MLRKILILFFYLTSRSVVLAQPFRYPEIPPTITGPQERMEYLFAHFWDECDFSDTRLFESPKPVLDYLYLLRFQTIGSARPSIKRMVSRAETHYESISRLSVWLQRYLHDSQSPYYDDELYLCYLEEVLASNTDASLKIVPKLQIEVVRKNRIGQLAEDFWFVTKEGVLFHLMQIESPYMLIMFTNPTCPACHHNQLALIDSQIVQRLLNAGRLTILSIDPGIEFDSWLLMENPNQERFIPGYDDIGAIQEDRLYDLQRLPTFYLLNEQKEVLLKEADLKAVLSLLSTLH